MSKEPISRAFKQDFPEFVERAQALGVRIQLWPVWMEAEPTWGSAGRVYWLDGCIQLTGYERKKDGSPFTHEDAVRNIDKALTDIEDDRREIAGMSQDARFARVMAHFRQMTPQQGMIGEVRLPSGDTGHCFFFASYDGDVSLHEIGTVACATVDWKKGVGSAEQMAAFCDQLEQDYARRKRSEAA